MNLQKENCFIERGCQVFPLRVISKRNINYSYIILDLFSRQAAIVDPAWDLVKIVGKLKEIDADLTTIIITHSHYDHVNLVGPLIQTFGANVVISSKEKNFYGFSSEFLSTVHHLDEIKLGKTVISCLLTPGHTAGGMCYLLPDFLFTGDTIFIEGCGLCTTEGGSPDEMFESIQMVKRMVGDRALIFPGHSYGLNPGCEFKMLMKENIYFQIETKDDFINFRMREGQKNLFNFK